jgi:hypothetical protein
MKQRLSNMKQKILCSFHEQKGQSLIVFAMSFMGIVAMLGLAIDLGLVYIERVRVNKAIDAAVLAAAVELSNEEDAMDRAIEYIIKNGYDVGGDVEVVVRGCVTSAGGDVNESGTVSAANTPMSPPTEVVEGYVYKTATIRYADDNLPRRATFMIDTGSYQEKGTECRPSNDPTGGAYGSASRIRMVGQSYVDMNFMRFFGFAKIKVVSEATAESLSKLDIMVVFDLSGSMEGDTGCIDCWVKTKAWETKDDVNNEPYPEGNGYFNPLPFNPNWWQGTPTNIGKYFIPESELCTYEKAITQTISGSGSFTATPKMPYAKPYPVVDDPDDPGNLLMYQVHEAEFYSRVYPVNGWDLDRRSLGQGFWSIQRGTMKNSYQYPGVLVSALYNGPHLPQDFYQGNQAGVVSQQAANICNPGMYSTGNGNIDCTLGTGGQTICEVAKTLATGEVVGPIDCSGYIQAKPFLSYWFEPNIRAIGGVYDQDCITNGNCWGDSSYTPESTYVEYDFANAPGWGEKTYIWARTIGSGHLAFEWGGSPNPQAGTDPYPDGNAPGLRKWYRETIFWEVLKNVNDTNTSNDKDITGIQKSDKANKAFYEGGTDVAPYWRDTRARNQDWRWIYLGEVDTPETYQDDLIDLGLDKQYTLRIYQGSPGYKIDRIVFTNNPADSGPREEHLAQTLANRASIVDLGLNPSTTTPVDPALEPNYVGPPISSGSATREACNPCNPAYGWTVTLDDQEWTKACNCRMKGSSGTDARDGLGCTTVQPNVETNQLGNDLYAGLQPFRSAQEAVKNFITRLEPDKDQVGFVGFSNDVVNDETVRSKLQCLNYARNVMSDESRCATNNPITYTKVIQAVENQWPLGGTNTAAGIREGLEELGIDSPGNDVTVTDGCSGTSADGQACNRRDTRKILILLTDGMPTDWPGSGSASGTDKCSQANSAGNVKYWDGGTIGIDDKAHQCAMFYAQWAAANDVALYTIGLGGAVNAELLEAMATGTYTGKSDAPFFNGLGKFYPAASPLELEAIFDDILDQLYVRLVG